MKYTRTDLAIMQQWPLWKKVQVTQAKIIEFYRHYAGKVCVSFSGGKDSLVLLDLVRRIHPRVKAVFLNTGMEYPEILEFVHKTPNVDWIQPDMSFVKVVQDFGYPVVSKEIAQSLYYAKRRKKWAINKLNGLNTHGEKSQHCQRYIKYNYLLEAPFSISSKCCEVIKKRPLERYMKESGLQTFIGTLAEESFLRQSSYLTTGCNAFHVGRSQPISFWTSQDILEYLHIFKIPAAKIYGDIVFEWGKYRLTGVERTGCMFCMFGVHREKQPNRFQRMRETHPKHYDFCINRLGCGQVMDFMKIPY